MQQVNIDQAKTQLDELLQAVLDGDEVIILRDDQPVVKLVPFAKLQKRRVPGTAKGQIIMSPDFNEPLENFKENL